MVSSGNVGLLAQYGIDWTKTRQLSRVREAHHVIRTFLDEQAISHDGEFYRYDGLFTFAKPVQERLPLKLGAMRGPKSFQAAGEISDGVRGVRVPGGQRAHRCRAGRPRLAGPRHRRVGGVRDGPDGAAAKQAARAMVGLYASSMSADQLRRNGVEPESLGEIIAAVAAGDLVRAYELTPPDLADKLSTAGTPRECAERIERDIAPTGVNHMILAVTDSALVRAFSGLDLPAVLPAADQLRLISDEIMPRFARVVFRMSSVLTRAEGSWQRRSR